jgi:cobalamin transport system substrate-binding protein
MRISVPLICIFMAFVIWLTSCAKMDDDGPSSSAIVTETDAFGIEVGLSEYPDRIVSTAPNNTEILLELGARGRLVGVSSYYGRPELVEGIERTGGYINPSLEKIMALEPDIVFAARGNPKDFLETLRSHGIKVFAVDVKNLDDLFESLGQFGRLINEEERAGEIITGMKHEFELVSDATATIDEQARPRVLWVGQETPFLTAGPDNMIDELVRRAGGKNAAGNESAKWPTIDLERLLIMDPEVIIMAGDMSVKNPEKIRNTLKRWQNDPVWKNIDAVQTGRVHFVATDLIGQPSPRNIEGLKELLKFIQPEIHSRLYREN